VNTNQSHYHISIAPRWYQHAIKKLMLLHSAWISNTKNWTGVLHTVEPLITDPPTSGQSLYNKHWLWHQMKLLQN